MTECPAMIVALVLALAQEAPLPKPDPAPEAPMELGIVLERPRWKSAALRGDRLEGSFRTTVPDGIATQSNGFNPPLVVRLEYEEKDVEAFGGGLRIDFNLFQLSVDYYEGDWDGEADLVVDDGLSPAVRTPVDVEGDFQALKFAAYWPGLRMRSRDVEVCLGVEFGLGWFHEDLDPVPQAPLPIEDSINELIGTIGPRLTVRIFAGPVEFTAEAAALWVYGDSLGLAEEISAGVGLRF